jgi:hypothetical protein
VVKTCKRFMQVANTSYIHVNIYKDKKKQDYIAYNSNVILFYKVLGQVLGGRLYLLIYQHLGNSIASPKLPPSDSLNGLLVT